MNPEKGLFFLPLGGAEEIGMNLNLYGLDGKWLMIDLGVAFGEDRLPGVDTVMPDPKFIEEKRKDLVGLVLTHGHEDHLGGIRYLWPRLRCPIYATPFTAALLWSKVSECKFKNDLEIIEVPLGKRFLLGPFDLQYITTTHSIPEPNAIAVRTKLGTVLHTGDFKVDEQPVVGKNFDKNSLSKIGDEGVLAVVCDSTNVFESTDSESESSLIKTFQDLILESNGLVFVTTFASNVARIQTIINSAIKCDRHPILIGRSIVRTAQVAEKTGYLKNFSDVLMEKDIGLLPREKVVVVCTGSQGEERGALARIANGKNRNVSIGNGDITVFSSKIIPGNEKAIARLQNQLAKLGVRVITEKDALVHVSGHPSRGELAHMYNLTRPKISIPVHGERRHIAEHAKFARQLQIPEAIEVVNGSLIQLAPGPAKILQQVHSGKLALDGSDIVSTDNPLIQQRRKLMVNGIVSIIILIDDKGNIVNFPKISTLGVMEKEDTLLEDLKNLVAEAVIELPKSSKDNDEVLAEVVRRRVRKEVKKKRQTRPEILVEILRIEV